MLRRKVPLWAIGCLFAVLALPRSAAADLIRLTDGFAFVTPQTGEIQVVGERGFSLTGALNVNTATNFQPSVLCNFTPDCVPGTEVSLAAVWVGSDIPADMTFEGETFTDIGHLESLAGASLEFSGSFVAPALDTPAVVTAPFAFMGSFSIPVAPDNEVVRHMLTGGGIATISLSPHLTPGFDPAWRVDSVRYAFSDAATPVPEPATMLLVGLGMVGVARRMTRARAGEP